jgi:hypothetical protein
MICQHNRADCLICSHRSKLSIDRIATNKRKSKIKSEAREAEKAKREFETKYNLWRNL